MALIAAIKTLIARSDSNSGIPDFRNFRVFLFPDGRTRNFSKENSGNFAKNVNAINLPIAWVLMEDFSCCSIQKFNGHLVSWSLSLSYCQSADQADWQWESHKSV